MNERNRNLSQTLMSFAHFGGITVNTKLVNRNGQSLAFKPGFIGSAFGRLRGHHARA